VLSACSTYFDAIFSQYEENNPIVILKDVKFTDIKALVEFMYKGEINIDHVSEVHFELTYCNLNYVIL
jgi:uridine kinase